MPRAEKPRSRWLFMSPRDIGLFLRSARTDQSIARLRAASGARAAFEAAYENTPDPWASADPRYFYQRWKYEGLIATLPQGRRFGRALDLGSGVGAFSLALTAFADEVLGLDIAQSAVDRAARTYGKPGLAFARGDVCALDSALDGRFDLVVVADTLYYLDAVDDFSLRSVVARVARLLAPGGLCLVANHYFFAADRDSRLSRRIHDAFDGSPDLALISARRRPFYLTSLLGRAADLPTHLIPDRLGFDSRKASSPFLQKRTKKLLFSQTRRVRTPDTPTDANRIKAFCFFFSKKKALPYLDTCEPQGRLV